MSVAAIMAPLVSEAPATDDSSPITPILIGSGVCAKAAWAESVSAKLAHAITERLTGLGIPFLPLFPEDHPSRVFLTRTAQLSLYESREKRLRVSDLWKLRRRRKPFQRRREYGLCI